MASAISSATEGPSSPPTGPSAPGRPPGDQGTTTDQKEGSQKGYGRLSVIFRTFCQVYVHHLPALRRCHRGKSRRTRGADGSRGRQTGHSPMTVIHRPLLRRVPTRQHHSRRHGPSVYRRHASRTRRSSPIIQARRLTSHCLLQALRSRVNQRHGRARRQSRSHGTNRSRRSLNRAGLQFRVHASTLISGLSLREGAQRLLRSFTRKLMYLSKVALRLSRMTPQPPT